jgi:hypothetical protein
MKKLHSYLFTIACVMTTLSCTEEATVGIRPNDEQVKEYKQKLVIDGVFNSYLEQVGNIRNITLKSGTNYDLILSDLNSILSKEDFELKIRKHFEYPEQVIDNFKQMHSTSVQFWKTHEDLKSFTDEQQQSILENAIEQIAFTEKFSKYISKSAKVDPCQAQYNSDIQTCREGSYTAAAFCGLLSPTLVGALACGAAVVAADIVCHRGAARDLALCRDQQNPS